MEGSREHGKSPPSEKYRWKFVFAIGGDLRFISHHDTLRMFRRAAARADLPVRYSEGYNPHPRITIPLPRPVGIASRADVLVVETDRAVDPQDALQRLDAHTPEGVSMISSRRVEQGERFEAELVRYRLELPAMRNAELLSRVRDILDSEVVHIQRVVPKTSVIREIDVRPFLIELIAGEQCIEFLLRVIAGQSAKPSEVASLFGCDMATINHQIERLEVQWRQKSSEQQRN